MNSKMNKHFKYATLELSYYYFITVSHMFLNKSVIMGINYSISIYIATGLTSFLTDFLDIGNYKKPGATYKLAKLTQICYENIIMYHMNRGHYYREHALQNLSNKTFSSALSQNSYCEIGT